MCGLWDLQDNSIKCLAVAFLLQPGNNDDLPTMQVKGSRVGEVRKC